MIVGIGIDVLEFSKLEHLVKTRGQEFTGAIFTEREIHYAKIHHGLANLATAFTAKEAVVKSLSFSPSSAVSLRDIEVKRSREGKPSIHLHGKLARSYPKSKYRFLLSLSFTETTATAIVLLESSTP